MGSHPQPQMKASGSARLGNYLRRLRTGYGYSLRRVEERAKAEGGEIDNSQLSRYEKGICYPSFDKLRVLASVFNVSIQSFSDVVELEAFEHLKPEEGSPENLRHRGNTAMKEGVPGRAFACYERALELIGERDPDGSDDELFARLRFDRAVSLKMLGKLSLAEQDLRRALKLSEQLSPSMKARAMLTLANIHADLGERFLAELEAQRAHELALQAPDDKLAAMALHTMGHVLAEQQCFERAIERFREAAELYSRCDDDYQAITVRINVGANYVALGKAREGLRALQGALHEARREGHRRLEALAWSNMGNAYFRASDVDRARRCFRGSDALANGDEKFNDILFYNSYYEWKMALQDDNPTRAKLAFGRLKALRSTLERRIPEVEAFDEFVERGRAHA